MDAGSCFNTNANRGKDPPTKLANQLVINIVKETRIAIPHPTFGIKIPIRKVLIINNIIPNKTDTCVSS